MSVNTHFIYIYIIITHCQLLDSIFVVGQRIIAHIAISIVMIPLGTAWMSATLSYRNDDETGLCQSVCTRSHTGKRINRTFNLRPRINIVYNRIYLCRIEIKRFIHHTIKVGHSIGSFHLKRFGKLVTGSKKLREITFLNRHHFITVRIQQVGTRHCIDT